MKLRAYDFFHLQELTVCMCYVNNTQMLLSRSLLTQKICFWIFNSTIWVRKQQQVEYRGKVFCVLSWELFYSQNFIIIIITRMWISKKYGGWHYFYFLHYLAVMFNSFGRNMKVTCLLRVKLSWFYKGERKFLEDKEVIKRNCVEQFYIKVEFYYVLSVLFIMKSNLLLMKFYINS